MNQGGVPGCSDFTFFTVLPPTRAARRSDAPFEPRCLLRLPCRAALLAAFRAAFLAAAFSSRVACRGRTASTASGMLSDPPERRSTGPNINTDIHDVYRSPAQGTCALCSINRRSRSRCTVVNVGHHLAPPADQINPDWDSNGSMLNALPFAHSKTSTSRTERDPMYAIRCVNVDVLLLSSSACFLSSKTSSSSFAGCVLCSILHFFSREHHA
jgi:hypothetical protein